jgi:hypothetical protein
MTVLAQDIAERRAQRREILEANEALIAQYEEHQARWAGLMKEYGLANGSSKILLERGNLPDAARNQIRAELAKLEEQINDNLRKDEEEKRRRMARGTKGTHRHLRHHSMV